MTALAVSSRAAPAGPRWWIEAAGRVWGPYPRPRMEGFVAEGRLTAASLVGDGPDGPFAPAALDGALVSLFVEASPRPTPRPEPAGAARPMLVFAALKSTRPDLFETALAAQGEHLRLAPGLWAVKARCAAAPLRNQLSRRLREGDVLVVTEMEAAQAAWFALPGDTDRALRRLMAPARGEAVSAP